MWPWEVFFVKEVDETISYLFLTCPSIVYAWNEAGGIVSLKDALRGANLDAYLKIQCDNLSLKKL